jgi:hypothetical protein
MSHFSEGSHAASSPASDNGRIMKEEDQTDTLGGFHGGDV